MEAKHITIYTDGSCLGNPGPGGYGVVILENGDEIKLSGGEQNTTNNRMEMTAVIMALNWLILNKKKDVLLESEISILSDSNLLIETLTKGWKRKANLDLWLEIDTLRKNLRINWRWVKAHATDKYNIMADKLALKEAQLKKSGFRQET